MPPVLACFSDQDARVRYYACESMYNIAKVAKGEILLFFNEVFDALAKVRGVDCFNEISHTLTWNIACVRFGAVSQKWRGASGSPGERYCG